MKNGFVVCYSDKSDTSEAFSDICNQIGKEQPCMILFFSDMAGFSFYTKEFHEGYPKSEVIGATTYVALSSKGCTKEGITALVVMEGIECAGGVILDVTRFPAKHVGVIRECVAKLSKTDNSCCFTWTTAFDSCEEIVQDTFRSVLEELKIPVFGGSAGNIGNSTESFVSYNGTVFSQACVFFILRNKRGRIRLFRENLYRPTNQVFDVTDVECEERTVYELDGKPAAKVLAKALNTTVDELPALLPAHPLGRIVKGEIYITEHNEVTRDGALTYFARIYNHTKTVLLAADDPHIVLNNTIADIHKDVQEFRFMLVVNCLSRSRLYEQQDIFETFTRRLKDELGEYIGISGYGEQMNYEHLNQTMLIAVFE